VKIESSVFREGVKALPLIAFGVLRDLPRFGGGKNERFSILFTDVTPERSPQPYPQPSPNPTRNILDEDVKIESSVFREGVKALPLIAFGVLRALPRFGGGENKEGTFLIFHDRTTERN
jgi:hypothetical protein